MSVFRRKRGECLPSTRCSLCASHQGSLLSQDFSCGPPTSPQIWTWRLLISLNARSYLSSYFNMFLFMFFLRAFYFSFCISYFLLSLCLSVWVATAWLLAQGVSPSFFPFSSPSLPLSLSSLDFASYLLYLAANPAYPYSA